MLSGPSLPAKYEGSIHPFAGESPQIMFGIKMGTGGKRRPPGKVMMGLRIFLNAMKSRLEDRRDRGGLDRLGRDETETVRKIVRQLDTLEPESARFIAAFAYILSRVARADMNISDAETEEMERQVIRLSRLPEEQGVLVVHIAKAQATLFGGTENFLVTQ